MQILKSTFEGHACLGKVRTVSEHSGSPKVTEHLLTVNSRPSLTLGTAMHFLSSTWVQDILGSKMGQVTHFSRGQGSMMLTCMLVTYIFVGFAYLTHKGQPMVFRAWHSGLDTTSCSYLLYQRNQHRFLIADMSVFFCTFSWSFIPIGCSRGRSNTDLNGRN